MYMNKLLLLFVVSVFTWLVGTLFLDHDPGLFRPEEEGVELRADCFGPADRTTGDG
jgi:hypothetical protein